MTNLFNKVNNIPTSIMNIRITTLSTVLALALGMSSYVYADTKVSLGGPTVAPAASATVIATTSASSKAEIRMANIQARAGQEIARRITALKDLTYKIQSSAHIDPTKQASMISNLGDQINALNALQSKINADTTLPDLQVDVQSITSSYRIFMLVIPQYRIAVADDRIQDVIALLTAFTTKLSNRIAADATNGLNTTALSKNLADMNAKVIDAGVQSAFAVASTTSLVPDQADKTVQTSNTAALKDAAAKIKLSMSDIVTVRAAADVIVKGLSVLEAAPVSSSSTPSH